MKRKLKFLTIVSFGFCMMLGSTIITSANSSYPNKTQSGHEITLTKENIWLNDKNKGEVQLTFDGLQKVYEDTSPTDFIFVLDTSDSMGRMRGCLNHDHTTYMGYKNTSDYIKLLGADWETTRQTVMNDALDAGEISYTYDATEGVIHIDSSLKVEVPASYYTPEVQGKLYYVPAYSQKVATSEDNAKTVFLQEKTWKLVGSTYYHDASVINAQNNIMHYEGTIETGTRIVYEKPSRLVEKDLELWYINDTYLANFEAGNVDAAPGWWDLNDTCFTRAESMYNSTTEFAKMLLNQNGQSRISFVAYNTKARDIQDGNKVISQDYQNFTSSYNEFNSQLEHVVSHSGIAPNYNGRIGGQTNYKAGLLSLEQLLNDDTSNSSNQKVILFMSDGQPNGYTTSDDPAGDAIFANDSATAVQNAKETANRIYTAYPDALTFGIALGGNTVDNVKNYVGQIMLDNSEVYAINEDVTTSDVKDTFDQVFQDIASKVQIKTKVVTVTDVIDNRYFTIDEEALLQNKENAYFPQYASAKVTKETIDGVPCQKVTFTYQVDADQTELEKVSIPVLLNPDADASNSELYAPTGYDPTSTQGGANANYKDLSGQDQTLETLKTWLPTGAIHITKVDAENNDIVLAGAQFQLYYSDGTLHSDKVYTTNELGQATKNTLAPGDYYFVETKAPTLYKLENTKFAFTIQVQENSTPVELVITNAKDEANVPGPTTPTNPTAPQTGDQQSIVPFVMLLIFTASGYILIKKNKHLNS